MLVSGLPLTRCAALTTYLYPLPTVSLCIKWSNIVGLLTRFQLWHSRALCVSGTARVVVGRGKRTCSCLNFPVEEVLFSFSPLPSGSKQAINMEIIKLEKTVSVLHPADNVHRGCSAKWMGLSLYCTCLNSSWLSLAEPFIGQVSFILQTWGPLALLQPAQPRATPLKVWVPSPGSSTWTESMLSKSFKGRETMQVIGEDGSVTEWRKRDRGQAECSSCRQPIPVLLGDRELAFTIVDLLSSHSAHPLSAF